MLTFELNCGDPNTSKLVIRGASFECASEPEEETMIAPLNAEAYNPEGTVIVDKMVFLAYAPVLMDLNAGIAISCPFPGGSGTMSVDIYADGQKIFDSPIVLTGSWVKVTRSAIKEVWRILPAGTRLDVKVASISVPDTYPTWRGLQVCFLPKAIEALP